MMNTKKYALEIIASSDEVHYDDKRDQMFFFQKIIRILFKEKE